jgi:glycosyltransferase involved in cell wall biosynthesis
VRICLVYDCLYPHTVGGAERWYRNLAQRLAEDGHQVTYLTLRQWDRDQRADIDRRVSVRVVGPQMALYTASGRRRILPPLIFGLGVLVHLLRHPRDYEVLHTCSFPYFSLLAAASMRPLCRFRLVVDWFEVWSEDYWRSYLHGIAGRVGTFVQRLCAIVPQHAFCFSDLHSSRLRELGLRGEVTVLRGLYAGARAPATPQQADPLVLFVGRLIPEKRVTLGVAAVALAARRLPGLRGVFYGDGPEKDALLRAIAEHDAKGYIKARGFVESDEVDGDMSRALCLLLPSSREGYGLVVVEACAHATPVVVVPAPDNAAVELIEDGVNGVVAASAQPEAIAEAIMRVHAAGLEMRERTARWFAEHADRLSLESSLREVLESYADPEHRDCQTRQDATHEDQPIRPYRPGDELPGAERSRRSAR